MHTLLAQQAQFTAGETVGILGMGLLAAAALAYFALVISALIGIVVSQCGLGMKLVWVVLVFMLPFLGSLAWFFIGRHDSRRRTA